MTREEFSEQIVLLQGPVRRFLLALCCGDCALADDLAQETFLKAYVSLDSYSERHQFKAWLHRIAYNCFIDWTRRRKGDALSLESASGLPAPGTEERTDMTDTEMLDLALKALSVKERSLISLFYVAGYSQKEIASMTGTTVPAVKMQLSRARERLKQQLCLIQNSSK